MFRTALRIVDYLALTLCAGCAFIVLIFSFGGIIKGIVEAMETPLRDPSIWPVFPILAGAIVWVFIRRKLINEKPSK